jgi:hypothetical protein
VSNTYEYKISNMQRDADTGIVIAVEFTVAESNGTDSFTHNYQSALPAPKADPTPYDELTEADVIVWVKDLVGKQTEEQADAELDAFILRKKEVVENGTPW